MKRLRRSVPLALAAAAIASAAAIFTLLHLPASRSAAQTPGDTVTPNATALMQRLERFPMVLMLPPNCTFQPLTASRPQGAVAAFLDQVPSDLNQSAGVEYTPCSAPAEAGPLATPDANAAGISFHIISAAEYVGTAGTVYTTVDAPSAGALSHGLNLGSPAGTLPDGTPLYVLNATESDPSTMVQWMRGSMVITVAGDLPPATLEALAASITVR